MSEPNRECLMALLADAPWGGWPQGKLADKLGTSEDVIMKMVASLEHDGMAEPVYTYDYRDEEERVCSICGAKGSMKFESNGAHVEPVWMGYVVWPACGEVAETIAANWEHDDLFDEDEDEDEDLFVVVE